MTADIVLPFVVGAAALAPAFVMWRWAARYFAREHPAKYADAAEAAGIAGCAVVLAHAVVVLVWLVGRAVLAVLP